MTSDRLKILDKIHLLEGEITRAMAKQQRLRASLKKRQHKLARLRSYLHESKFPRAHSNHVH
jgi:hypothetical protein